MSTNSSNAWERLPSPAANLDGWFTQNYAGADWSQFEHRSEEAIAWDELPFSSVTSPLIGMALYLVAIPLITRCMKRRDPISFPRVMLAHNLFLTAFSAILVFLVAQTAVNVWQEHGFDAIWSDNTWLLPRSQMALWCYIFYVSKYYELLDSLFLLLKKKKLAVVQVWHHASVLFLFWSYMNARMMNHWWLVIVNTFVHIFVYGYFAAATVGVQVPWKRYITLLQISQFVFDIVFCAPFPYYKLNDATRGEWGPYLFGNFVGVTFIILFTQIYFRLKAAKRRQAAAQKEAKGL